MKKIIFLLFTVLCMTSYAQDQNGQEQAPVEEPDPNAIIPQRHLLQRPREEDHFWRQRVVNRIDLREKINDRLIYKEMPFYTDNTTEGKETNGIVMALINGLKSGEYNAYDPDSLNKPLSYEDVIRRLRELDGTLTATDAGLSAAEEDSEFFDINGEDDFSFDEGDSNDPFASGGGDDPFADPFAEDPFGMTPDSAVSNEPVQMAEDFSSLESVIQFVEDRIFDRVRSDMVYDILFLELIWTDVGGLLPEEKLCVFRYDETVGTLEKAQWKNRFNDAEMRTIREIFDFRLFHSYIINVGGQGVVTLPEAEERRQKLVEFEHHLWSY